jgi:lipopolysaccharide export system protein LptA
MKKIVIIFGVIFLAVFSFAELINVSAENVVGGEQQYTLRDNVAIKKGDLIISTNYAVIYLVNDDWRRLESENTTIKSDTFEVVSKTMSFDLRDEKGTFKDEVKTLINIDESIMNIVSDLLEIDNKSKIYNGSSNERVLIIKDDYTIRAKKFIYNENEKKLTLEGDVSIINTEKKIDMKSTNAVFNTNTNEIEARTVQLTLELAN